jgi:multicomponent Na+:H+ antiporter subunit C
MTLALAVAALTTVGVWLLLRGGAVRLIVGFVLLGHAANLMLIAAGGTDRRAAPLAGAGLDRAAAADPLPQAFVLTAIVITFGLTVYLLRLAPRAEESEEPTNDEAGTEGTEDGR